MPRFILKRPSKHRDRAALKDILCKSQRASGLHLMHKPLPLEHMLEQNTALPHERVITQTS